MVGYRASSEWSGLSYYLKRSELIPESDSIIQGTRESLERMGLDYVDVIFAHRYDYTSTSVTVKIGLVSHVIYL